MADKSVMDQLQGEALTIRDHLDPDKHWIGESLGVPTQSEIAATVGIVSSPGESPFVARADHQHRLDPGIFPTTDYYAPASTDNATTSSTFAIWVFMPGTVTIPNWATKAIIQMNISNITVITGACTYALSLVVGSSSVAGDAGNIVFDAVGENRNAIFAQTVDLVNIGVQSIGVYARRISGAGQMQATTGTKFTTITFFKP